MDMTFAEFLSHLGVRGNADQLAQLLQDELSVYDAEGLLQFQPSLEQLEAVGVKHAADRVLLRAFVTNSPIEAIEKEQLARQQQEASSGNSQSLETHRVISTIKPSGNNNNNANPATTPHNTTGASANTSAATTMPATKRGTRSGSDAGLVTLDQILNGGELEALFEKFLAGACFPRRALSLISFLERHCLENLLFIRKVNIYKSIENSAQRSTLSKEIKVGLTESAPCMF